MHPITLATERERGQAKTVTKSRQRQVIVGRESTLLTRYTLLPAKPAAN